MVLAVTRFPVGLVLERLGVLARLQGRRWWAEQCPLPDHADHNPAHRWQNFFVRDESGTRPGQFHCFSCKGGGGIVELVGLIRKVERREAIGWLRDLSEQAPDLTGGVRIRHENVDPHGHRFRLPEGVEQRPLGQWPQIAADYARVRGIEAWQVARWRIGYAPIGRLEGRLVFPTYSATGILLDYAARTYVGDPKRYLTADEREGPHKGAMFGEQFWQERRAAVVFEGAINGLAVERALPDCVDLAGLSGSHVGARQMLRLSRFRRLIVATDPDAAGDEAAASVEHGLRGVPEIQIARARFPIGKDAADMPTEQLRAELERCLGRVGI